MVIYVAESVEAKQWKSGIQVSLKNHLTIRPNFEVQNIHERIKKQRSKQITNSC